MTCFIYLTSASILIECERGEYASSVAKFSLTKDLEKTKIKNKKDARKVVFPIGADTHFAIGFVRFGTLQIFTFGCLTNLSLYAIILPYLCEFRVIYYQIFKS